MEKDQTQKMKVYVTTEDYRVIGEMKESNLFEITNLDDPGQNLLTAACLSLQEADYVVFYITENTFKLGSDLYFFLFAISHMSAKPHVVVVSGTPNTVSPKRVTVLSNVLLSLEVVENNLDPAQL